jgi:uncharacterized protein (DUF2336 family)
MANLPVDLAEALTSSLSGRSVSERGRIVRDLAALFLSQATVYSSVQVELFDTILIKLIDRIDEEVRIYLAESLAPVNKAPRKSLQRLASDVEIAVARPVLSQSVCLDEDFLMEGARTMGQEHLIAISSRREIGPRVTDILVQRGNDQVTLTLAQNNGAELSEHGCSILVERAKDSRELAWIVWRRKDIPRQHVLALFERASTAVRQQLETDGRAKVEEIAAAVRLAGQKLQEKTQESSEAYAKARAQIAALKETGGLSESHILSFARQRRFEEVVTSISEMSLIPPSEIERMILEEPRDRFFLVSKAIGLSWTSVQQVMLMGEANARVSGQLEHLRLRYQSVSREAAAKTLQFYQLRLKAHGKLLPARTSPAC